MINTINHLINSQLNSVRNSHSRYYQNCFDYAWNLYSKDLKAHYNCVNAIEFSNRESEHIASAGDDRRILIWSINNNVLSNKSEPKCLKYQHQSNVFTLAWDNENKRLFSGGNDEKVMIHDVATESILDIFLHAAAVFCISVNPEHSEIFASACENGQVNLFDLRLSNTRPIVLSETAHGSAYQACCFNPVNSSLIVTANIESGLQLIDLRMQNKVLIKYEARNEATYRNTTTETNVVMSVKFNQMGTQLLALRSRRAPVLYNLRDPQPIMQFDHEDFLNSCTLKSCCFAGDRDQYVCSGSDDFCVYIWKTLPSPSFTSNRLHLKLKGHRSIVNQVRYHPRFHILISSGVEKIIKVWTPFRLENSIGGLLGNQDEYPSRRKFGTYHEHPYASNNILNMDPLNQSMDEDAGIIAFFDSLVRKEMTNWSNEDEEEEEEEDSHIKNHTNSNNTDESSTDNSEEEEVKKNIKPDSLIQFLSDNENENNPTSSSSSSSCSNISMSSNSKRKSMKSKVRISLRDRLRNLRHRKSMNLTENSEFINVLDSLNVPHGSSNQRSRSNSIERITEIKQAPSEEVESTISIAEPAFKLEMNSDEHRNNVNTIKSLNMQRRVIELDKDDYADNRDEKQPTTSQACGSNTTKFKKLRKLSGNENTTSNLNDTKKYRNSDEKQEEDS